MSNKEFIMSNQEVLEWKNTKITRFMVEMAISRAEGRKHEGIDINALYRADASMQHKSLKSFVESYNRNKRSIY